MHTTTFESASRSFSSTQTPIDLEEAIALAEGIDCDVTRLMIGSENKLKRHSPFPFSSVLAQSCLAVNILKLHRYCLEKKKNKTTCLERLQSHRKERVPLPDSLQDTQQALKKARKNTKKAQKDADKLRYKFFEELIANLDNP